MSGVPSRWSNGEGHVGVETLEHIDVGLPGVGEDGMPGRNVQRKLGTTRGSPRRSRTAKASRISRHAVKSRCACEWGGWGRLSDDGPEQNNPDPSEGPWGKWRPHLMAVRNRAHRPRRRAVPRLSHEAHEGRTQTIRRSAHAGSRLKLDDVSGRPRLKGQPSSRTGENSPYGMIGGIEETSASFEARTAPRSYPTIPVMADFSKLIRPLCWRPL
jgi:hypothetical protein